MRRLLCGHVPAPSCASAVSRSALRHRRRPCTTAAAAFSFGQSSASCRVCIPKPVAFSPPARLSIGRSTVSQLDLRRLILSKRGLSNLTASPPPPPPGRIDTDSADNDNISKDQPGLFRLLTDEQRLLLDEQRDLVGRARDVAGQVGGGVEVRDCLGGLGVLGDILSPSPSGQSSNSSDERGSSAIVSTFTVVIAGEFNAGKSTLINALLGRRLLETGALPTTDAVTVVAHGDPSPTCADGTAAAAAASTPPRPGVTLHRHPSPLLSDLTLIDTPGTNAVHLDHTARTTKLLPLADLILFVTSADRPFPESERTLLKSIQSYRKNVVIVLNKMDVLELEGGGNHGQREKDRVTAFVAEHASELLGARPVVVPVSARDALGAKLVHPSNDGGSEGGGWSQTPTWKRSNFAELERFLSTTLTDGAKVRSKLLNPVGVAERMLDDCSDALGRRRADLDGDVATLALLESQMGGWTTELVGDMADFRKDVGDVLRDEGRRCRAVVERMGYLDQWRWTVMGDGDEFDAAWSGARIGGRLSSESVEREVLDLVRESADNVATRSRAQGQAVIEYLGKRPAVTAQSLIGSVTAASRFEDTRRELNEKMSQSVEAVLGAGYYDPSAEREEAMRSLRGTVVASGVVHAGALAGVAMTAFNILDPTTGAASSSALAIAGAFLIPYRNRRVATVFEERWKVRFEKLESALEKLCKKEMGRIEKRIMDGISPYTRYVRSELDRTKRLTSECEDLAAGTHSLRGRINRLSNV